MGKRRRVVLAAIIVITLALGISVFQSPRRFVYQGKPLQQWLDDYSKLYLVNNWSEMQELNRKAHNFGPAAVPPLVAEMQSKHAIQSTLHTLLTKRQWKYQWVRDLQSHCQIVSMRPQAAAQILFDMGSDAASAIPALLIAATDTNMVIRANALNALGSIHQRPELCVPLLVRALTNSWDANFVVYSLGRFGTNAASAAPALRQLAGEGNPQDRRMSALMALEKIAPDSVADVAMPVYLDVLKNHDGIHTYTVILRLMKLGPRAKEAVPLLEECALQTNDTAQAAAYALKAIDLATAAKIWPKVPREADMDETIFDKYIAQHETQEQFTARVHAMGDQALPYLIKLVQNRPASGNNITDYERAAHMLGEMSPAARAAIPDLTAATGDSRWFVRVPAQASLIKLKGEPLSPVIEKLKDTSDSTAWYENAMLVAEFGTNAEPAIPVVIEAMKNSDDIVQGHGAILLGAIHRQPEACLPVLISLLESPSVSSRQKAVGALTQFGDAARPALPQIKNALDDFDPWTRVLAKRLVKQLDTNAPANSSHK